MYFFFFLSFFLFEKQPQSITVTPSVSDCVDVVLWVILSVSFLPNIPGQVDAKEFDFDFL